MIYRTDMYRKPNTSTIIHVFALLHALVAAVCIWMEMDDELLLTVLTMTMIVIICLRNRMSFEFSAIFIILANIIGYMIGTGGADIIAHFTDYKLVSSTLSTAFTTEIVGWGISLSTNLFRKESVTGQDSYIEKQLNWIILAVIIIFALRILFAAMFSAKLFTNATVFYIIKGFFSDSLGLITTICLNVIYIGFSKQYKHELKIPLRMCLHVLFILAVASIATFLISADLLHHGIREIMLMNIIQVFLVMIVIEISIFCIVYIAFYALWQKQELVKEQSKVNWEKYRYLKLKQQVDPHFLFNSLNILDCLVCEEKNELASTYIHKLAGIYRYMLKSEDNMVVSLNDELTFANLYLDLLKVRFQDGFRVTQQISEACLSRHVIPCSLQMLLENAFKHNAVQVGHPLEIHITADDECLTVSNNLIPKLKQMPSTGIGLKYITQQYSDTAHKTITINKTETTFTVKLPLL